MRTSFSIPATAGTYTSPEFTGNTPTLNSGNPGNTIAFEFYDDEELTIPSTGVTGTITVNGKVSKNSIWQNIPDTLNPSTINAASPYSLSFNGVVYQLQIITLAMTNTNYINIIFHTSKST